MEVTFRPVLKAAGWIFELQPVRANRLFVDSNFKQLFVKIIFHANIDKGGYYYYGFPIIRKAKT